MIPILYEATELNFTSNGVCRLAEATECHVTEERNGEYELTLTYPITGKYYDQIQEGMYIAATHDDKSDRQAFRIYRRSAPFNGLVQFFAHHISYMLNNIILNPITATSAADAFDQMETDTVTTNPFTMWTDVTTAGDFDNETPTSIRSALGGKRGSILDVYGGEYEWNMFTVKLHAHRGLDSDATIRYGKNLTDLTQTIDAGGLYNAIVPYWFGTVDDEDVLVTLPEQYVAADGVTSPVMVVMDFSSEFQDQPTEAQLRAKASSYLSSNQPWIPSENIKISFVQLWQTEEYKDVAVLQRLSLCDRVNVYYPALGITAEGVKIIKTNYNVLLDRYDEMELGDARSTFADTLIDPMENAIEAATENLASKSFMQRAIDHATELITGGLGGHIIFLYDANGKPTDMLVMDTESVGTAVNVLRINVNGIGFSSNGVNGPFESAWTLDGQFVADFITAGTMLANRIKGGTLSLGGVDNGNGVLRVYDASGTQIGLWNKDGIIVSRGSINGPSITLGGLNNSSGVMVINDASGNQIGRWDNTGLQATGEITLLTSDPYGATYMGVGTFSSIRNSSFTSPCLKISRDQTSPATIELALGTSAYNENLIKSNRALEIQSLFTNSGITSRLTFLLNRGRYDFYSGPNNSSSYYADANLLASIDSNGINGNILSNLAKIRVLRNVYDIFGFDQSSGSTTPAIQIRGSGTPVVTVNGQFSCTGAKNRRVRTDDYSERLLYSYETPSPLFGDVGEGTIGDDGKCYVMIDSIFSETTNLSQYQVFLQKYGAGDCWVSDRTSAYFVVEGTPGMPFGWEIKAKQAGLEQMRLEEPRDQVSTDNTEDYAELFIEHIKTIRDKREGIAA